LINTGIKGDQADDATVDRPEHGQANENRDEHEEPDQAEPDYVPCGHERRGERPEYESSPQRAWCFKALILAEWEPEVIRRKESERRAGPAPSRRNTPRCA